MAKTCFIVAGPNGAGKTTFAHSYLPIECLIIVVKGRSFQTSRMSNQEETRAALAAMERAAETARARVARFGSRLAFWKDGAVVLVDPLTMKELPHSESTSSRNEDGDSRSN